jgi:hypothetical protein
VLGAYLLRLHLLRDVIVGDWGRET